MDTLEKKILLVEDDALVAMHEKQQLEQRGYAVTHLMSGEEAIQYALAPDSSIDLILMDIDLGAGIDGTQAAEQILRHMDIPIVFLSSHTEYEIVEKTEKITSYGYAVKNTGCVVLDASIKMALKLFTEQMERRRAEEAVRNSEEHLRAVLDSTPFPVAVVDIEDTNIQYWSKSALEKFGHTAPTAPEWYQLAYPDPGYRIKVVERWKPFLEKAMRSAAPVNTGEYEVTCSDGSVKICELYASFISENLIVTFNDITERKRAEEALRDSEERFRILFEHAPVGVAQIHTHSGEFIRLNQRYADIVGYTIEEMKSLTFQKITQSDDLQKDLDNMQRLRDGEIREFSMEKRYYHKDGSIVWVNLTVSPMWKSGEEPSYHIAVVEDITERKRAEDVILRQLSEKGILLREVHHRVKNNILNIESFLSLQVESNAHPEVKAIIQDAVSRVKSMRVLYDNLLLSTDYQEVSMKVYMENIITSVKEIYPEVHTYTIESTIADVSLPAKHATSLGIILNELLTNIFKYAFQNVENGHASVMLEKSGTTLTLTVCDNGSGFDEQKMSNQSSGFGLKIIEMLTEQLRGSFTISNENGTQCIIRLAL